MTVDASPFALRAILKQKLEHSDVYKVVPYTSWSLTELERCYSQTEHEAHAVVWGSAFLAFFPYGINFKLFIDHKALLQIYSHTSKPSVRIERWVLCLQQFDFEIKHNKVLKIQKMLSWGFPYKAKLKNHVVLPTYMRTSS